MTAEQKLKERHIIISSEALEGQLIIPVGAQAIVLFAHGSGSGMYCSRNRFVANIACRTRFMSKL